MTCKQCEVVKLYLEDMDFCPCGDPSGIMRMIRDVLNEILEWSDDERLNSPTLASRMEWETIYSAHRGRLEAICNNRDMFLFFINQITNWGWMTHGSSVNSSFLEPKGREILALLNAVFIDDIIDPFDDHDCEDDPK